MPWRLRHRKRLEAGNGEEQIIDLRVERFLEPCLLLLLVEKPAHGYKLIDRLNQVWLVPEKQDPGAVYRNLRRLERGGMVKSQWDTSGRGPAKRLYEVTPEGEKRLAAWASAVDWGIKALIKFLERYKATCLEANEDGKLGR